MSEEQIGYPHLSYTRLQKEAEKVKNELTLTDLVTRKPTEAEYDEIISLLTTLAKQTYEEYKFFIARSTDETKQPNFLQIVSHSSEAPELHKLIFAKAVNYGIDMQVLQGKFAQHIALNQVVDLGEGTVVILDDNSPSAPTGVSPINSGLEGGEIAFIISFIKSENYKEWHENTFPKEEEDTNE